MPEAENRRIVLAARPTGAPKESDFRLERGPAPEPGPGQVLCRTIYLSLDPYMRGRMNEGQSYTPPVEVGAVMTAEAVCEVAASNSPDFSAGDLVVGRSGWQELAALDAGQLRRVDPANAPISTAVGVLGMPGMTAYTGLLNIGRPEPGETVVVAAAAGAVGGIVGQIARIKGARAVGIAGSPAKCAYVTGELGFDACVSHRDPDLAGALARACPDGIDVYFENVGGAVLQAVLPLMNPFSRMPVCGLIAHYNATELPPGPDQTPLLMRAVLTNRINIRGFIVWDFGDQAEAFRSAVGGWIREGRIRYREDIVEGLENTVATFQGLLRGENFGKQLIRVAPDPTAGD